MIGDFRWPLGGVDVFRVNRTTLFFFPMLFIGSLGAAHLVTLRVFSNDLFPFPSVFLFAPRFDAGILPLFETWLAATVFANRPAVPTRAVPMLFGSGCKGWNSVNLLHQVDRLQLCFMTTLYRNVVGERCRSFGRGRNWSFGEGICCRGVRLGLL